MKWPSLLQNLLAQGQQLLLTQIKQNKKALNALLVTLSLLNRFLTLLVYSPDSPLLPAHYTNYGKCWKTEFENSKYFTQCNICLGTWMFFSLSRDNWLTALQKISSQHKELGLATSLSSTLTDVLIYKLSPLPLHVVKYSKIRQSQRKSE